MSHARVFSLVIMEANDRIPVYCECYDIIETLAYDVRPGAATQFDALIDPPLLAKANTEEARPLAKETLRDALLCLQSTLKEQESATRIKRMPRFENADLLAINIRLKNALRLTGEGSEFVVCAVAGSGLAARAGDPNLLLLSNEVLFHRRH